ncbi:hypothetical protein ACFQ49_17685 [Kroppenstedtia eburnea]|uniref:hypothetical protein n=1 Tax=Kroppenstedtia eburnea TaxID=714067 RepID=UPI003636EE52
MEEGLSYFNLYIGYDFETSALRRRRSFFCSCSSNSFFFKSMYMVPTTEPITEGINDHSEIDLNTEKYLFISSMSLGVKLTDEGVEYINKFGMNLRAVIKTVAAIKNSNNARFIESIVSILAVRMIKMIKMRSSTSDKTALTSILFKYGARCVLLRARL